jgi:hypothetical protein
MLAIFAGAISDEQMRALIPNGVGACHFGRADAFDPRNGITINFTEAIIYGNYPVLAEYLLARGVNVNGKQAPKPERKYAQGMFTGKRVALIGPAPHITKRSQVAKLKGYDYICRINRDFPVKPKVAKTTTDRTDVWYPALPLIWYEANGYFSQGMTALVKTEIPDHEFPSDFMHLKRPLTVDRNSVDMLTGCSANRGMIAIMDIIEENPAELYITGITFYQDGIYHDEYLPEQYKAHEYYKPEVKGHIGNHNPLSDLSYFAENIAILPQVKTDKELSRVLSEFKTKNTRP